MKKMMNFLDRAEAFMERAFVIFVACAIVVLLLTGCDCGCGEEGTLKLRDNHGEYTSVCHGKYLPSTTRARFTCDDGRTIWQPVNFIIDK
jgi:hypothetical protein